MLIRAVTLLSALISLAACQPTQKTEQMTSQVPLPQGVTLINQKSTKNNQVTIPYTKYQLTNGLTLVLHQDNSDPLVHVDVTYHVGSSREEVGKSGFAHFFEHMMFQGSENVADEEHFKIITEAGGEMNGSTNSDRTNYYQTVPANQLEKVLWLEADRMGFLLDAVTQEKFEVQRETVKNERAQRVDNQPYGLRNERTAEALYPAGHPYSWPVIGYVEDLDRVNVNDLKAFFSRWYGPNNAVLSIGGNIDVNKTLAWVNKYFGGIPRGPEVMPLDKSTVALSEDRYITLEDEVHLPLLQMTFPTVHARHPDEAPLDVLSDILGNGKTSLFYKNLVKNAYSVQAVVSHPCRELACEFQLIALANPAKTSSLAELKSLFKETLLEFEARGVNADDLTRTKASIEAGTIWGLQSVSGKVSSLAHDQTFENEPDMIQYDLDRYNAVTAEDVMRVYKKYIKDKNSVVLSIVPIGQIQQAAASANYQIAERVLPEQVSQPFVTPAKAQDKFDRGVQPKPGANPVVKTPDFERVQWPNGIEFITHQTTETPTVTISFSMEGGPLLDPIDKAGLASITAAMMNESSKSLSNEQMANQLALLGSSIQFSAGGRYTQVSVSSLKKNLDKTLALFQQKLFEPAFLPEDFARLQQRLTQSMQQGLKNPSVLASMAVSKILYGQNNRVGLPDSGTQETLQNISLADVKGFYQQYYSPVLANLVVVGDIDPLEAKSSLAFLRNWQGKAYEIPTYEAFPSLDSSKLYLVDKPGAAQSVVRLVRRDLAYDALGQQFRSKLMNFPLGGNFNSRINLNLREDKGYTYGARSSFVGGKTLGRFQVGADVKQENTLDSINEMLFELNRYRKEGMTQSELEMLRNAYTQSDALEYETPGSKAGFLRHLLSYDLDSDYRDKQNQVISSISAQELNKLASLLLNNDDLVTIVVGDKTQLEKQLAPLGKEIVAFSVTN